MDRGGRTGTNLETTQNDALLLRSTFVCTVVEQQRYGTVRLGQLPLAPACAGSEPDHIEIGAWSRDQDRGHELVISVPQLLHGSVFVTPCPLAQPVGWRTHVSATGERVSRGLRRLLEDSATSSFLVRVSTAVSVESWPSTWPAIVSA